MSVSHASVHPVPVEAPPLQTEDANAPLAVGVRMKDIQGMPGTIGGLFLRFAQFAFALVALSVMATTSDFPSVTAFCYLVAAAGLQSLWSLALAIVDIYALLVGRSFQNQLVVSFFAVGDGPVLLLVLLFLSATMLVVVAKIIAHSLRMRQPWPF